jgi:hypothetical protein
MPLERFSDRSFIRGPKGVRFGMREGRHTALCILTREALVEVFGSPDQEQWEIIFEANRALIEAVASDIYDTGEARFIIHVTPRELDPRRLIASAVNALNRSISAPARKAISQRIDGENDPARPLLPPRLLDWPDYNRQLGPTDAPADAPR